MTAALALVVRALRLVGLTAAPWLGSPEPLPPAADQRWLHGVAAVAVFLLVGVALAVFRAWIANREATYALGGWVATIVAALAAAHVFSGARAPLLGGIWITALPFWGTLGAVAASFAARYLGSSFKNKRTAAAVALLAAGVFVVRDAAARLSDPRALWEAALEREPGHERAIATLSPHWLEDGAHARAAAAATRCIDEAPRACPCLALRLETRLAEADADGAATDAQRALEAGCPDAPSLRASLALARSRSAPEDAEREAQAALAEGGRRDRALLALAIAADRSGRTREAYARAVEAAEAGAGADAELLAGALAIAEGDLRAARGWLKPLATLRPDDPRVAYDLALIADRAGDFNEAREGYLRALRLDPALAEARYNLAVLTFRAGVLDEAKHHVEQFLRAFPDDPRGDGLAKMVGVPR